MDFYLRKGYHPSNESKGGWTFTLPNPFPYFAPLEKINILPTLIVGGGENLTLLSQDS